MNRTRFNAVPFNFGSGPSQLPESLHVLLKDAIEDFDGSGLSVLEISHRDDRVLALRDAIKHRLRSMLGIPEDYAVLICPFSASLQFAAVPLNLLTDRAPVVVEMTGYWSDRAAQEFERTHPVWRFQAGLDLEPLSTEIIRIREEMMATRLPGLVFHCDNETIDGIEWFSLPHQDYFGVPAPRVVDMSSNFLTRLFSVEDYDCIFASTQKTLGLPGLSVAIVRRDRLGQASKYCPKVMNYGEIDAADSILNTLPVLTLYTMKCMLDWIVDEGGIVEMERRAQVRSALMYSFIDQSTLYENRVPKACRSRINIPFGLPTPELTREFLSGAEARGLRQLRGHRSRGGIRASLYNAMSIEGVEALLHWMAEFEASHHAKRTT